jgi:hypothetical protein
MAYDELGESVALIESRHIEPVRSLTRRRRFAAMGVDVSGDAAVSMFARRGVGCVHQETHVLARHDRTWKWVGGTSVGTDQQLLADRPAMLTAGHVGRGMPVSSDPRVMAGSGPGGARDCGWRTDKPSDVGRWISYAILEVNSEVTSVEALDRSLRVPWHGKVVLVWCGDEPSRVVARSDSGEALAELRFG